MTHQSTEREAVPEMVERVARAIHSKGIYPPELRTWEDAEDWLKNLARDEARAAIEEMRRPTDAMIVAGVHSAGEWTCSGVPVWEAMIDEALR